MNNLYENDYDLSRLEKIKTKRYGFDLFVTPRFKSFFVDNVYEETTALLLRQNIKGVQTFIDIGAHYGFYDVLVGKSNPDCHILAFEPVPENIEILRKNISLNKVDATVYQAGVSDRSGRAPFEISEASDNSGFIANPSVNILRNLDVDVVQLDQFQDQIPDGPVLIKLDTEGHEINVLDGMQGIIDRVSDLRLVIEFNPKCLEANGHLPQTLLDRITDLGFDIFCIDDEERKYTKYIPDQAWQTFTGKKDHRNIFCIKRNRSLNLCIFSHSAQRDGAERSMLEYVESMIARFGIICTVVLPNEGPLIPLLEERGVATKVINYFWWCASTLPELDMANGLMGESYSNVDRELRAISNLSPDVILTNTLVIPWGAFTAFRLDLPHIWFVREFGDFEFYFTKKKTIDIIIETSNHILVNAPALKRVLFSGVAPDMCSLATNKIVLSESSESSEKYFRYPDSTKLVISGAVVDFKGQDDAIHATRELIGNGYNVELCILGNANTPFGRGLKALVKTERLEERIHFLGFIEDVRPVIEQSTLGLTCSNHEAFGRATAEAMLLGKPVIGTDAGGTVDLIQDGVNGFLYDPGDIDQLKRKITYFIDNPKKVLEFGQHARKTITQILAKHPVDEELYRTCLDNKGNHNPNSIQLTRLILEWHQGMQENFERRLIEKEQDLKGLLSQLEQKDKVAKAMAENVQEKEQANDALKAQIIEKEQANDALTAHILEKEQSIQELTAQKLVDQQSLQKLLVKLNKTEVILQDLIAKQQEKNIAIQTLSSKINKKDKTISQIAAQVTEKEQTISNITKDLEKVGNKSAEFEDQLHQIRISKIWRMGMFFRRIRTFLAPPGSRRLQLFLLFFTPSKLANNRSIEKDLRLIRKSNLYDRHWYLSNNIDVKKDGIDPARHYLLSGGFEGRDPGPAFNSTWYLDTYQDVRNARVNPLVHYIKYGLVEGRKPNPPLFSMKSGEISAIDAVQTRPLPEPHLQSVDIIICVHNALNDVRQCLSSVVLHTSSPYELILVDDGSETATASFLVGFAKDHPGTLLIKNEVALGYTFAANKGLRASKSDYVLLLNSDTIVVAGWLDRMLACALEDQKVGMVGPLSNTASWQSIPEIENNGDWATNPLPEGMSIDNIGELLSKYSGRLHPRLPFLNGFCLLLSKRMLSEIGLFDEIKFGKGYGEENDLALRARKRGWQLALADDTYVYHAQSRSYSDEARKSLSERAGKILTAKHGPEIISKGVEFSRNSLVLEGIRARARVMVEREKSIAVGRKYSGKKILFLLPISSPGGGGNVVVFESLAMRKMGVSVELFNLPIYRDGFEASYPDISIPVRFNDLSELSEICKGFDAVIATHNASVEWLLPIHDQIPNPRLGYYMQDFEPLLYGKNEEGYSRARSSYGLIPRMVRFTKTEWNHDEVLTQTGMDSKVVGVDFDIDLYRPRPHPVKERQDRPLRIGAMIRPESPYRAPEQTMRLLKSAHETYGDSVEIVLFGTTIDNRGFLELTHDFPWKLYGVLPGLKVANLLNSLDIFIDASSHQAMGLTALEAMACGCAVILPRAGGATTFCKHMQNGIIVETSDSKALWQALNMLITDNDLRQRIQRNAVYEATSYYPERVALNILDCLFSAHGNFNNKLPGEKKATAIKYHPTEGSLKKIENRNIEISQDREAEARSVLLDQYKDSYGENVTKEVDLLLSIDGYMDRFHYLKLVLEDRINSISTALISGYGAGSEMIVARNFGFQEIYGVEVVPALYEATKIRLAGIPGMVPALYDGLTLPYRDEQFNIVISGHIIEHTLSPKIYIREAMRVLKSDGILYIEFPNRYNNIELHTGLFSFEWLPTILRNGILKIISSRVSFLDPEVKRKYDSILSTGLKQISRNGIAAILRNLRIDYQEIDYSVPRKGVVRWIIMKK